MVSSYFILVVTGSIFGGPLNIFVLRLCGCLGLFFLWAKWCIFTGLPCGKPFLRLCIPLFGVYLYLYHVVTYVHTHILYIIIWGLLILFLYHVAMYVRTCVYYTYIIIILLFGVYFSTMCTYVRTCLCTYIISIHYYLEYISLPCTYVRMYVHAFIIYT